MAMALVHDLLPISLVCQGTWQQLARVEAEPHRSAHLVDVSLLRHEIDHGRRGERGKLGGVRVWSVEHLAGEVDHRALHAQAQAEVRDAIVSRVPRGLYFALDPAI